MSTTEATPEITQTVEDWKAEQAQLYDVNGQQVSLEELQKGYLRQSDYTRKMQEVAAQRKQPIEQEQPTGLEDQEAALKERMKANVLTEFEQKLKQEQQQEVSLRNIFTDNPELRKNEEAIKELAKQTHLTPEEVVVKYNFTTQDKLAKAKARQPMGDWAIETPAKTSWTPQEREEARKTIIPKASKFERIDSF